MPKEFTHEDWKLLRDIVSRHFLVTTQKDFTTDKFLELSFKLTVKMRETKPQ